MDDNLKNLNGANEGNKTFDDFLKESDYQAEFDKRLAKGINTALETERGKMQQELDKKLSEVTTQFKADSEEQERLKEMKEIDQVKYHYDKQAKELENLMRENNSFKLEKKAIAMAKEKNMDLGLLDVLDFANMQETELESKIDSIVNSYNKSLENRINEKFKEPNPKEYKQTESVDPFNFNFTGVRPRP